MHIVHINLAKGFRGGERQTLLLIKGLSEQFPELEQTLVIRQDSPLADQAAGIDQLTIITIAQPFIFYLQKIKKGDIIHAHEAKACHFAYWLSRRISKPYIITRRMDRAPGKNWFTRQVYRNCAHVVSLSSAIESIILALYPTLAHSVIPSMYASLPSTPEEIDAIRSRYPKKILIGNIGALVKKHKGQQFIIAAAKLLEDSHPEFHFLILGEGKDGDQLKQDAAQLNNISFLGFKTNVGDYYQAFDMFLFPSLQEGLGSALLDAMAAGLPIIATNVGGIPDIIHDRKNGALIAAKDSKAIAQAIISFHRDREFAKKMAAQSQKEIQRYHPATVSKSYMAVYQSLLSPPKKSKAKN